MDTRCVPFVLRRFGIKGTWEHLKTVGRFTFVPSGVRPHTPLFCAGGEYEQHKFSSRHSEVPPPYGVGTFPASMLPFFAFSGRRELGHNNTFDPNL